ncbi:MAG: cation:proton antiporter [Rhodospirillaceae bacterium]|jgi:CPA2 family monovalent cation:H+ antiporter-2|nr:cation:proton antiporter [Rhodospirillaceae bacterium]MBT5523273.1 cation:proton antiporter [Rhodospirillaceae bacterium]MBT5878169.1 cation:proton antiporter [Rhodospirillaceae bacterium]MBT6590799.1 cation:proton antiporter [Rhodospirillaceae bacterium]MBT6985842.1 cation:proton antiporter [Rhodospirillaceae bacterium]
MHTDGLFEIALLAAGALILGLVLQRLRQPAIVGYIAAGIVLGPSGFDLFPNRAPIETLAQLGVLLLLFVIGMELSLRAFRRVLRLAVLGAGAQIILSIGAMLVVAHVFDYNIETAIVMGFVVALSSTAVAIKLLEDIGELRTAIGRTAIGVLIAQDLAIVPMLLIVDGLAGGGGIPVMGYVKVFAAVALLAVMIAVLTRRSRIGVPFARTLHGNVELAAITALAYCFGAALVSALLGLSPAYGAFLAGLWIGNSTARAPLLAAARPIQGVLLMVFFVSIGLLLDLSFIWEHLAEVLSILLVVTVFKTVMNVAVLRLLREPWPRAWIVGVSVGQIGEFSFVLVAAGVSAGLILDTGGRIAVSVIALSLMLSPLWWIFTRRLERLVGSNVQTLRGYLRSLFAPESRAVATMSQYSVGFSIGMGRMGQRGYQAAKDMLDKEAGSGDDDNPDNNDARFEDDEEPQGDGPNEDGPNGGSKDKG